MHSYFFKSFGLIQGAVVGFEDFTNWMHTNYLLDKLLDRLDKFFGVARRQKTFTAIRGLRERHELQMHLMAFMMGRPDMQDAFPKLFWLLAFFSSVLLYLPQWPQRAKIALQPPKVYVSPLRPAPTNGKLLDHK